jgi:hypothetical protein
VVFTFAAYSLKVAPSMNEGLSSTVSHVFHTFVQSEIEDTLSLTNTLTKDLLLLNETEEENMFFEITERGQI